MFSQASASHSIHGGGGVHAWSQVPSGGGLVCLVPGPCRGENMPERGVGGVYWEVYQNGGGYTRGVAYTHPNTHPNPDMGSGHGLQADGTHPTGMLFLFRLHSLAYPEKRKMFKRIMFLFFFVWDDITSVKNCMTSKS